MVKSIDETGNHYGRLTVITRAENKNGQAYWKCKCECGNVITTRGTSLRKGITLSCGCLLKEISKRTIKEAQKANIQHNMSNTPEYSAWTHMKQRCYNQNDIQYINYGHRGIKVCERWVNSFENFFFDMGPRPSSKHSLDRKDNNLGYSKRNCRWATTSQQGFNKRKKKNTTSKYKGVSYRKNKIDGKHILKRMEKENILVVFSLKNKLP